MAPTSFPASLADSRIAFAPPFTASAMRCACMVASSFGGVIQSMRTFTLFRFDNSAAASSAPFRPERNTGLVELLAIMAMVNVFPVETPRQQPHTALIEHHCEDHRRSDDDPLIILVEMQCADRLADHDDEKRAKRGAPGAAATAQYACT